MEFRNLQSERRRVSLDCGEESMTQQCFKDQCNVNNILAKYQKTGMVDHLNKHAAQYADLSELGDYRENIEKVRNAEILFNDLPSAMRNRFANDPAAFLEYCSDPSNLDELIKTGVAKDKGLVEAVKPVEGVSETPVTPETASE